MRLFVGGGSANTNDERLVISRRIPRTVVRFEENVSSRAFLRNLVRLFVGGGFPIGITTDEVMLVVAQESPRIVAREFSYLNSNSITSGINFD